MAWMEYNGPQYSGQELSKKYRLTPPTNGGLKMSTKRIRHSAKFKFTIALEAIKSDKSINQLASDHQLHPSQISQWKKQLLEQGSDIFATSANKHQREQNDRESNLYEQIGRLNMELNWLKKKAASSG